MQQQQLLRMCCHGMARKLRQTDAHAACQGLCRVFIVQYSTLL
jgi:hypothetical protein